MRWMILGALALAACDQTFSKVIALESEAEIAVKDRLRDPSSAQFSGERTVLGGRVVCGRVNAKNGLGGYTGPTGFIYNDGQVILQSEDMDAYAGALPKCAGGISSSEA